MSLGTKISSEHPSCSLLGLHVSEKARHIDSRACVCVCVRACVCRALACLLAILTS